MTSVDKEAVRAASRLEDVIPALTGGALTRRGREVVARCPFHQDTHPSLRVNVEKQQWRCDVCDVGGDVFGFVERCRHESFAEALIWLAHRAGVSNGNGLGASSPARHPQKAEREHIYVDERREPVRKVVIGGRRPDGDKIVWQERPDGRGGWVKGTEGQRRVLYRLADLLGKPAVVVAEGEKDVDRLWAIGIPATCNLGGAGNWNDSDTVQLKQAGVERVRITGDHDDAGRRHNTVVARSCTAHGIDARPVLLPGVPDKGDVSDFVDAHGATAKADLEALLRAAPPWTDPEPAGRDDADDHLDVAPLVDATWPAPMSRAAYVGIVGDIVDVLAPQTEADPAALLIQLLAMFGDVIGRSAHFRVEADTHYLALFVVLVGKTAKGRKGVSEGRARHFFGSIDEQWITQCQASGLSSGEGLIAAIRDPVEKQQPIRERKRIVGYETVIEDHGVPDKRLYVSESEFASTLKVMMREGNTLSPVLRNAWDGKTLRTLTKTSPLRATGPHVAVVGNITQHEVRRYLDATESANGFGNRFLWVCVQRSQYLPDGGVFVAVDALIDRLRARVAHARECRELRRDAEAKRLWHRVYHQLSTGRPGLLGALTARAEAQVMRLACLYALGDGSHVVRVPHLEAALEVWRYCFDSAAYIFGDSLGDPEADRLLAALKAAGGTGLTRSEIIVDVFQKHLSATRLSHIMAVLQEAALAVCRRDESRGGRPAERWLYAPANCERSEESLAAGQPQGTSFASFAGSPVEDEASFASFAGSGLDDTTGGGDQTAASTDPATEEFDL